MARRFKLVAVEKIRGELLRDHHPIDIIDFKSGISKRQTIGSIAKTSASNRKFAAFLSLLIDDLKATSVLETGTSLGLTTMYLAASKAQKITTIEGSNVLRQLAQTNFRKATIDSIDSQHGDIHLLFPSLLASKLPDFIFLDADHRGSTVQKQVEQILKTVPSVKCIVIHDIHWSKDMNTCWNDLIRDQRVNLTIDIFQAGLVFPSADMEKQHFTLRF